MIPTIMVSKLNMIQSRWENEYSYRNYLKVIKFKTNTVYKINICL